MDNQVINSQEKRIKLPELLGEFREALESEIEAIKKKSSSSAIPLVNGKRITDLGNQYQYVFILDSILDTPDGSPAELIVPGKPSIEAIIVTVEELRITLSVGTDLGDFVPFAKLQSDLSILLKKLIDRIENHSSTQNLVGLRMLGKVEVEGTPISLIYSDKNILNQNQKSAIESAVGRNLTYIWGPPGTGKTTTIGAIIKELYMRERSVLLVSHTNTAVDQAIIKSAENSSKSDLEDGYILRLGVAKNPDLCVRFPQITIEYQHAIKGKELNEQLDDKTEQFNTLNSDIDKLNKHISCYHWLVNYKSRRADLGFALKKYKEAYDRGEVLKKKIEKAEQEKERLAPLNKLVKDYMQLREIYNDHIHALDTIDADVKIVENLIIKLNNDLVLYKTQLEQYRRRAEIERELSRNISTSSQLHILGKLENDISELQVKVSKEISELEILQERFTETTHSSGIKRLLKGLPKPEQITQEINVHQKNLDILNLELNNKSIEYGKKQAIYKKNFELEHELKSLPNGDKSKTEAHYIEAQRKIEELKKTIKLAPEKSNVHNIAIAEIEMQIQMFKEYLGEDPTNMAYEFEEFDNQFISIKHEYDKLIEEVKSIKQNIDSTIDDMKKISTQIELPCTFNNYDAIILRLDELYNALSEECECFSLDEAQETIKLLKDNTKKLTTEINEIKVKLGEIDKQIIEQAKIVGTTLTKAYLSDELQARKFDTVILDEASMASIPALWATTLMSSNNVIIVGDFKQLPPIVLSDKDIAKKWIGSDIFEVSGIRAKYENKCHPEYFVILNQQLRMEPVIADIANRYYEGILESPNPVWREKEKTKFEGWYTNCLGVDSAVTLVDTESLNAWVTSVTRGNQSSRLNFLSATLSVNIAEKIVSNYQKEEQSKESKVLIISPYRPHTKLIDLLLKDSKISNDIIRAGTVHSFQGSEADVVIFDLVVDEPHFRVNLFMSTPEIIEQMKRLFNVSVTRAKFKLIIVGDFKYCMAKGKNSELGNLLHYLIAERRFPVVDAKIIAPSLYEEALKAQQLVVGGKVEPDHERLVVTQELFYKYLSNDLENATDQVIIYSPFMTIDRLSYLLPQIQAAIKRKVSFYVITKSLQERKVGENTLYREMEGHLFKIGVTVIHKKGMHEKLVFIDDKIIWNGSLNPLSFSSTQEIMERRTNKNIQNDFREVLRIKELIECVHSVESKCPICNSEMIAAEGKDDPYYWRCVNENCFTRSIDQKYPINGELTCANCGGAVEFGYWGEEPSWRCAINKRHHQKLFRSHLRLPKMERKIPKQEKNNVRKYLDKEYPEKSPSARSKSNTIVV